ncbi:DUF2142 domain-containing protein [Patescibacteria group bacterium]
MKIKLFSLLLIAYFLKQLVWLGLIPIWHFPDEEQHFAITSFYAEKNSFPKGSKLDVNKEIDESSKILGTKRDKRGINKFTYNPDFRIPYTKDTQGLYEEEVKNLNTIANRQEMVKQEGARYGPIYYFLTSIPYKVFYNNDLITRVMASRLISVLLSLVTVYFVYLISKEIFKEKIYQVSLTFLVAMQPMFSFVSSGVSSDNMFNLIFTGILYLILKIFFKKTKIVQSSNIYRILNWLLLFGFLIAGFYTKKQIFIVVPIFFAAFLLSLLRKGIKIKTKDLTLGLVLMGAITLYIFLKIGIPEFNPNQAPKMTENLLQYIYWHLRHTIAETIPWYWGVFNWLGVTLPSLVLKVQARILIVSAVGFIVYMLKQVRNKTFRDINNLKIIFLLSAAGIYYFSIIFWDYFYRTSHSFSFGIQGRYFFPTIISHMLFIMVGLLSLVPDKLNKVKQVLLKILIVWWVVYSFIGLKTAAGAYFVPWPLNDFLIQASQYKPVLFKVQGLLVIIVLSLASLLLFLFKYFNLNERKVS